MNRQEMLTNFTRLVDSIYSPLQPAIQNKQELQNQITKAFPQIEEIPFFQALATNVVSDILNQMKFAGTDFREQYRNQRNLLNSDPLARRLLPYYIRENDSLEGCINALPFSTAKDKCSFLQNFTIPQFIRQIDRLSQFPSDLQVARIFAGKEMDEQFQQWLKALERREHDPSGAITAAKTMLESVCKKILRDAKVKIEQNADLPKLYKQVADKLNLTPSQDQNEGFRQFTGGAASIVNGLCAVRNKMGDAHDLAFRPGQRHAELAVNLAGSLARFLVEVSVVAR